MTQFREWPKISRVGNMNVTITEKIDGTNAAVIVEDGQVVGVQSRNHLITPESDNYGFARWVSNHATILANLLSDGYHYGEWAGPGIQKNPLGLDKKKFFLFNSERWSDLETDFDQIASVPVLYKGPFYQDLFADTMNYLKAARPYEPEGIVIYWHNMRIMQKMTYNFPDGKWQVAA